METINNDDTKKYEYVDTLVGREINKEPEEINWNNSLINTNNNNTASQYQQSNSSGNVNVQPTPQIETQNVKSESSQNQFGYDQDTLNHLAKNGITMEWLNNLSNFDPNKNLSENLKMYDYMKPSEVDEKTLRRRQTWGAIGDSLKLLAQMATSSAGAHITPNKDYLQDYFSKLNEDDKKKYETAMNMYKTAVNQATLQNQKNNYAQYRTDNKRLADVINGYQKQKNWEANQKAIQDRADANLDQRKAESELRQSNADRNYNLNEKRTNATISQGNARIAQGAERNRINAEKSKNSGGKGVSDDENKLYYSAMADENFLNTLPRYAFRYDSYGEIIGLNNSSSDRKEIARRYGEYLDKNQPSQTQSQNQYGWNNFNSQYNMTDGLHNPDGSKKATVNPSQYDVISKIVNKYPHDDTSALKEITTYLKNEGYSQKETSSIINSLLEQ